METVGVFAAADYEISYSLTLSAGLRYTSEEKKARIASLIRNVNSPCQVLEGTCRFDFTDSEDWNSWSPKLGFTYHLSDTGAYLRPLVPGFPFRRLQPAQRGHRYRQLRPRTV